MAWYIIFEITELLTQGDMVIILKALDKERIDEVINVSKEMNRTASEWNRFLWYLIIPTYAKARPHYIYDRSSACATRGNH